MGIFMTTLTEEEQKTYEDWFSRMQEYCEDKGRLSSCFCDITAEVNRIIVRLDHKVYELEERIKTLNLIVLDRYESMDL